MYSLETFYLSCIIIAQNLRPSRKKAVNPTRSDPPLLPHLLFAEGHAVGALVHSGIAFMGTHQDALQGAEILLTAVVCTLTNGTFNALVCVTIHVLLLLFP